MLVKPSQIIGSGQSSRYSIRKMSAVLQKQGQIEPLQVAEYVRHEDGSITYITFIDDPHGADMVDAAKALGWDTMLVVVMKRYEA